MDVSKELFLKYKNWIIKNPPRASELESFIKIGSYMLAGRFQTTSVICELIYSSSRLFELFNDFIISGTIPNISSDKIKKFMVSLTVLEYLEVPIEVATYHMWGDYGRRCTLIIIQLIKAMWRFYLLMVCKIRTINDPPIKPVDRKTIHTTYNQPNKFANGFTHMNTEVFQELRSGRVMRRLGSTPPPHLRTYSPTRIEIKKRTSKVMLTTKELISEAFHIMRPLTHLTSLILFGEKSWMPYSLALCMDLTSIRLKHDYVLTKEEEMEMIRRRMDLLYYLVRTPAFQTVTHREITKFLMAVGYYIPGAKYLCTPLLQYIPHWQSIYSYSWS